MNPKSSLSIHDKYNPLLANLGLLKKKKWAFSLLKPKNQTWGRNSRCAQKWDYVSFHKIKMSKKEEQKNKDIFNKKKGMRTLEIDVNIQKKKKKKKKK